MNKAESKYFNTAAKMNLALISLLKDKPFEYITVSEICKKAGVNRSTFYLHYETVGDLLEETTRYLINHFLAYFSSNVESVSIDFTNCELNELIFIHDKYLKPYLTYIKENKEVFSTALEHNKTLNFGNVHRHMFDDIYNPVLDRFGYPEKNRSYIIMYYINGIIAIIRKWLMADCDRTVEEISEIITTCIFGLKK